ncbi:MAG TPA: diguanylate cyclase [Usitatibacteraceae bacterium]
MSANRLSLLATLRRANIGLVTMAIIGAWLALTIIAYVNLRVYVTQNLQLVANSIAYSAQAATVFQDALSAQEILNTIASQENLIAAEVVGSNGKPLATFRRKPDSLFESSFAALGDKLFPQRSAADIRLENKTVGRVTLQGTNVVYVKFFASTVIAVFILLALVALAVAQLSRRVQKEIVSPLNSLASLTHAVRVSRTFDRRAPPAKVVEIHQLGEDFNALLTELQKYEEEQKARAAELQSVNESLSHQATHDGLTGLANRAHFREHLARALSAQKDNRAMVGVLYLDYDHFKSINDRLGHAVGDKLLIEVARRLSSIVRRSDLVARLGGDEFAVLLAPLLSIAHATNIAEKIVTAMRDPIAVSTEESFNGSVSVGVAVAPEHATTLEQLLLAADGAMYQAKEGQRDTYRVAAAQGDAGHTGTPA